MKKINIENLKKASSRWKNTRKKLFNEDEVFLISTKMILENLYFTPMTGLQGELTKKNSKCKKVHEVVVDDYNCFI